MKRIGDVLASISIPVGAGGGGGAVSEPEPRCPVCKDAGWVKLDVPVGHPFFGKLLPCECKQTSMESRNAEQRRRLSNLEAFQRHEFDDFEPTSGTDEAYEATRAFAREPEGWLFLQGRCGVGKTHLAVAAAKEIQRQNANVIFAVVPDLLDHLRATFDPSSGAAYDDRFTMIRGAFLLVLDDLGTENTTPWAREKLYQIINHRYNERLPTIITSNQDQAKLDERILSRLLDRGLTRDVYIHADDYRRKGRPDYVQGRTRRGMRR